MCVSDPGHGPLLRHTGEGGTEESGHDPQLTNPEPDSAPGSPRLISYKRTLCGPWCVWGLIDGWTGKFGRDSGCPLFRQFRVWWGLYNTFWYFHVRPFTTQSFL